MQTLSPTIDTLMKVQLTIKTDRAESNAPNGASFAFIYGLGADGITPFEKALFGKGIGDHMQMEIAANAHCATLGHLELSIFEQTGIRKPRTLDVTITDIVRAADREVVKAMASGGSCSDCGCGCGAH